MYRCANQIGRVLDKVYRHAAHVIDAVLVVDNRSPDNSREAAAAAIGSNPAVPTALVINDENYSLGGSHKVAFKYALEHGFSHVVVLHGDDQADIGDFVPLLAAGRHRTCDAVLGSRFLPQSRLRGYGWFRIFGNTAFNALFTITTRTIINDIGSGLNIFGPKVLAEGDYINAADDLTFHCFFLLTMVARKRSLMWQPISWGEEDQISNARIFKQSKTILWLLIRFAFARRALLEHNHSNPDFKYAFTTVIETFPF